MSPTFEFLVIFIGALLLGALLHKLCCGCSCGCGEKKCPQCGTCAAGSCTKGTCPKMCECGVKKAPQASLFSTPAVTPVARRDDDLTIIEGVGPAINKVLNANGVRTFADVVATPKDKIHAWLAASGPQFRMHDASTWAEQATLARDGKMAELEALKVRLSNGQHV